MLDEKISAGKLQPKEKEKYVMAAEHVQQKHHFFYRSGRTGWQDCLKDEKKRFMDSCAYLAYVNEYASRFDKVSKNSQLNPAQGISAFAGNTDSQK